MKRVMVVGGPGSGKSTLARQLGDVTGLPVHHMDMIHWKPGWQERSKTEKVALVSAVEWSNSWILEGGLSVTYDNRASRADTVVWLDLPLIVRSVRVVKRRFQYRGGKTRPDLPENCPEKLDREFLWWILSTSRSQREKVRLAIAGAPHLAVHHLQSSAKVRAFLDQLRNEQKLPN